MTEYLIKKDYEPICFTYYHRTGYIGLKMLNNTLSDNELLEYISDSLTHEHIHKILYELFDDTTSHLFDGIEYFFRNHALHEKEIRRRNQISNREFQTYISYIERKGFDKFLAYYNVTIEDIEYANKICNDRTYHKGEYQT